MQTLAQWLETHPEASATPIKGGTWVYPNGADTGDLRRLNDYKMVRDEGAGTGFFLRPLGMTRTAQAADTEQSDREYIAARQSRNYGGPVPVKELDLPRREESEADKLLEASPDHAATKKPTKKEGFLSRLKSKLKQGADAVARKMPTDLRAYESADTLLEDPDTPKQARERKEWERSAFARGARPFGDPELFSKTMPDLSPEEWERWKKAHNERLTRRYPAESVRLESSSDRYVVWVKEKGNWVEQGDGQLTKKTADRIAREIRQDCGCPVKVLPADTQP